jgi:hypothetical protein
VETLPFLGAPFPRFCYFFADGPSFEATFTCLYVRPTCSSIPAVLMPPKRPSKPFNLQFVSSYHLREVHITHICEDGTGSYQPRSASKKAAILRESLLTLAKQKQKQRQRQQAGHRIKSSGPATTAPSTPKRQAQQVPPPPTKPQNVQTIF